MLEFLYFLVAILLSLTVHEASHAMVAYYLGDPTAKSQGRVSLNPIRHLDVIGSLVFLVTMRFGWGKPVPVDPRNFKHPVRDNALTALAGPVSNFVMAFAVALPLKYLGRYLPVEVVNFMWMFFDVNVILGVFNLLPFPPLDGSKILGLIVPERWHRQYANYLHYGMRYFVAIILIDAFILADLFNFSFIRLMVQNIYDYVSLVLLLGT